MRVLSCLGFVDDFLDFVTTKRAILWLVVYRIPIPAQIESHVAIVAMALWDVHSAIADGDDAHGRITMQCTRSREAVLFQNGQSTVAAR